MKIDNLNGRWIRTRKYDKKLRFHFYYNLDLNLRALIDVEDANIVVSVHDIKSKEILYIIDKHEEGLKKLRKRGAID